jgi:hypothetical protein
MFKNSTLPNIQYLKGRCKNDLLLPDDFTSKVIFNALKVYTQFLTSVPDQPQSAEVAKKLSRVLVSTGTFQVLDIPEDKARLKSVTMIDSSQEMIRIIDKKIAEQAITNMKTLVCNLETSGRWQFQGISCFSDDGTKGWFLNDSRRASLPRHQVFL